MPICELSTDPVAISRSILAHFWHESSEIGPARHFSWTSFLLLKKCSIWSLHTEFPKIERYELAPKLSPDLPKKDRKITILFGGIKPRLKND